MALKRAVLKLFLIFLSTEPVEGASLTFKSVDYVQSCDSLSLGVFSVSDSVSDDIFKENLQNTQLTARRPLNVQKWSFKALFWEIRLADTELAATRSHRQIEAMALVFWCIEKN